MDKLYYLFKFSNKDNAFSLGIINEKKIADEGILIFVYQQLTLLARDYAKKNNLNINITPATDIKPTAGKDIAEYIYADNKINKDRFTRHLCWLNEKGNIPVFQIRIRTLVPLDELIGREEIISQIFQLIISRNISLRAPRCYGKTSILNAIHEKPPQGFYPLFIQSRNILTPEAFIGEIAYNLKKGTPSDRAEQRENYENKAKKDWLKTINSLFKKDRKYLLLIDEFAEFLRNLKNNDKINKFILDFSKLLKERNIRFILASSESEERIIGKSLYKKNFTNLNKIIVPLLKKNDAKLLLEELIYNSDIIPQKNDTDIICNLIRDYIPYFLHIFVSVWKEMLWTDSNVTPIQVYEELIGKTGWNLLRDFQDYPKKYPGKMPLSANTILSEIALKEKILKEEAIHIYNTKTGDRDKERFNEMIDRLKDDLLITENISRNKVKYYTFRSKLLMDFWKRFPAK